jgi:hypothetical protein
MKTALDDDLLIKAACFWLLPEIVLATRSTFETCGVLGAAKFVCTKALLVRGLEEACASLREQIQKFVQLEPTPTETSLAAEIELEAQRRGLELDIGESMLFAMVDLRHITRLATGDKRAIVAIEQIVNHRQCNSVWAGRVLCLEQIIRRIARGTCAAKFADKSLAICFSCESGKGDQTAWLSALDSYIVDIRKRAPTVLAAD